MRCNPWRWLWGIIPVGILAFLTAQWEHDRIETDLRQRSETALSTANLRWATTAFDGRDGLVTGQASADSDAERARRVVRDVWGVRVADARTHLLPEVAPYQWGASARGNRVRLSGYVPNDEMRSSILGVAKATFPKSEIDDKLELARGAPEANSWLGGISFAMRQLASLKNGVVSLRDNALSVEGEAVGFAEYKTVKGALRNNLPAGITLAADNVQPPVASPYNWSVKRTANQLLLSGHVPDEGVREQIFSFAKSSFPRLAIVDRLETAQGAPQGFAPLARVAIAQLVSLNNGEVKLTDKRVALSGEAADQATANSVVANFRGAAKGFDVSDAVTFPKPKPPVAAPYVIRADAGALEVVLTGSVPSDEARAEVLATARKLFAGRQVTDRLQLASGEPSSWSQCWNAGLSQLARLGSGTASMSDASLELTGVTNDEAVSTKLPGDLRAAANRACETTSNIRFDAPPEPDLTWRASHDGVGTVALEGEVPSLETRDALLQSAASLFPKANIVDRMKVVSGNPRKWQGVSLLGLKLLASLRKGEAVISRQELTVGGEAKDAAVLTAIRDNLARAVTQPYRARDAIEVRSDAMIWSENEAKRKAEEKLANERAEAEKRSQSTADAEQEKARAAAEAEAKRRAEEQRAKERAALAAAAAKAEAEAAAAAKARAEEEARAKAAAELKAARQREADACQAKMREVASSGVINFERASADLDRASLPTLARLAEAARACPTLRIEIEGHTDAEGLPERNASLSQRRAQSVVDYLAANGVAGDRLSAIGYGAERPIAPNDTAANRAKNRRIEFTVRAE